MTYRLFIDDLRLPPDDGNEWELARTLAEVQAIVARRGFPNFISFDHDLATGEPDGREIAGWMVDLDMDNGYGGVIPEGFQYFVHSANPPGAENIAKLLEPYLHHRPALRAGGDFRRSDDLIS